MNPCVVHEELVMAAFMYSARRCLDRASRIRRRTF